VNGVDVTNARHDEVIRLLTSDNCQEFTIVVYRDPNHPLSPTSSPRSILFMPSQPPVNMTVDSSNFPAASSLEVAKRPSPGPQLHISTTAGSPRNSTTGFVPRPTSAEIGKFLHVADAGKSPSAAVKTVTYNIGDSVAARGVEPPMPLMRVHEERTVVSSPRSSSGVQPVMRVSQGVPSHDGNLLFVTPPAPSGASTGSGVSDLFDALEKTYHASQQGALGRGSYDAGVSSTGTPVARGTSLSSADKKRRSSEVRPLL